MNGPQHYREAERLLKEAADIPDEWDTPEAREKHAAAQVHATLALAAATVHGAIGNDLSSTHDIDTFVEQAQEWLAVIADPQAGA